MNFIENGVKQNSLIFQNAAKGVAFHHAGMMTEERNIGKSPTKAHVRGQICHILYVSRGSQACWLELSFG